jgi:sec-independent protein translocase protein TatC
MKKLFRQRAAEQYGDDFFADTRMSFGEHIEDLRSHLVRALKWFGLGMLLGFFVAKPMLDYITRPVDQAIQSFYQKRKLTVGEGVEDPNHPLHKDNPVKLLVEMPAKEVVEGLRKVIPEAKLPEVTDQTPGVVMSVKILNPALLVKQTMTMHEAMGRRNVLTALSATEAFFVWMLVALVVGLVLSSPMVLYEIWSFVAAGLYPHEKRYVHVLLPFSIGLFLLGVAVCQFFVMPAALDALFAFNAWLDIEPDLRLSEWLGFAIMMPVVTGICFETPLVMMFLGLIGVFTAKDFLAKWRVALIILLIFAAIFSPSIDPLSLFILWIPMSLLYFLGVLLVKRVEGKPLEEAPTVEEVPFDPDMMKSKEPRTK